VARGIGLTPGDRFTEIFCGLIMVLTVTLVAGRDVALAGRGVQDLLRAAIGGNVAWGIIDGVVYLINRRFERARQVRLVAAVRAAADEGSVRASLRDTFDPALVAAMTPAEASQMFATLHDVAGRLDPAAHAHLTKHDFVGAVGCGLLCIGSALPAILPFLLIERPAVALRVSNAVLLASLFVLGAMWAKDLGAGRVKTGLVLLLIGAAMVAVAVAFGG
jgi:hypothetical protein